MVRSPSKESLLIFVVAVSVLQMWASPAWFRTTDTEIYTASSMAFDAKADIDSTDYIDDEDAPPSYCKPHKRIHVVYAVENLVSEKGGAPDSGSYSAVLLKEVAFILRQSLLSLATATSKEYYLDCLTVHIFCGENNTSDSAVVEALVDEMLESFKNLKIFVEPFDMSIVTSERKVWGYENAPIGNLGKLETASNYLRFYLAAILGPRGVSKFLYVDYDVMFAKSVHSLFSKYANGNVSLAAGKQNECTASKIITMNDQRLKGIPLKPGDPCMASGIMLINSRNWNEQNRTKGLEMWLKENKNERLWALGSLPPLMIEFAGAWEIFPSNDVADNKGYKVASMLHEAMQKNVTILHPAKVRMFVEPSNIWFQMTVSTQDDLPMLPHLLAHYKSLKLPTTNFLIVLHHVKKDAPQLIEATNITKSFGIFNIMHWVGPYSSHKMHANRVNFRKLANVQANDWVVHADSDQLHDFPLNDASYFLKMVGAQGFDSVYGYYVDRVAHDGSVPNITSEQPLEKQFPLSCHISTQIVKLNRFDAKINIPAKVMAFKAYLSENNGGGRIEDETSACVYPVRLKSHHFKWTWAVLRKMEMRAITEKKLPWGYQATNVIDYLKKHNGTFDTSDDRLKCKIEANDKGVLPVSSRPVQICSKYKKIDEDMTRID